MNYTSNYNLNLPERNEQFNLDDWNENTETIDAQMKTNANNIATNANYINTILTQLSSKSDYNNTNSIFYKLMLLIYPVGSIYWSASSTNPGTLFGGTWTQIKGKFILSAGDTYNVNTIGGNASITLTTNNMPAHTHSMSHTHTFSGTTDGMSKNSKGSISFSTVSNGSGISGIPEYSKSSGNLSFSDSTKNRAIQCTDNNYFVYRNLNIDVEHTHTYSGTTSTSSITSTGSVGSGTAFSIMPPYVVKYCWQRTV